MLRDATLIYHIRLPLHAREAAMRLDIDLYSIYNADPETERRRQKR